MTNICIKLEQNIKKLRVKSFMPVSQLVKEANVSKTTLINIEKGIANPLFRTILKIAKALKVHPSLLFKGC